MRKRPFAIWFARLILMAVICSALVFSGCGGNKPAGKDIASDGTSGNENTSGSPGTSSGASASASGTAAPKKTGSAAGAGPEGTWYEQQDFGGVLTVTKNKLIYKHNDYSTEVKYRTGKKSKGQVELIPDEDYWYYIDIFYDYDQDIITGHDMPHTDGDGGYHLHTFARTEYVRPPDPVYGERHDNSDTNAPKAFSDVFIRSLSFTVTEPSHVNGDMASDQPEQGDYTYQLIVSDDGSGMLSSDFCRDVTVTKEKLEELADLFENSALPSLNGIDIYTEEMPEGTTEYDLTIEFENGERYHSHANGKDVSQEWLIDGYTFHQFLFDLFVDAGYNPWKKEFHSTQPMKRIGFAEGESAGYTIIKDSVREQKYGTAYDYDVHCDYPIFPAEGDVSEALMETLQGISDYYKELALADLDRDYREMATAPRSIWRKADHLYAYSFYAVEMYNYAKNLLCFTVSEGHSNSLGVGKYGSGYYPSHCYCIDAENGRLLGLNDLFNDPDELLRAVTDLLCDYYNHSTSFVEYFTSEEYQSLLKKALSLPATEGGIGIHPTYDGLALIFPESLSKTGDYKMYITFYYDSIQDILNDKYCSVY